MYRFGNFADIFYTTAVFPAKLFPFAPKPRSNKEKVLLLKQAWWLDAPQS